MMDERIRNGVPYVFLGSARAMCGPYDDIVLPVLGEQHDWELELALVIGKSGKNIRAEEAMEYVAAYTICNDLTTRDRLYRPDLKAIGTDWFTAKNADTFLPTGPSSSRPPSSATRTTCGSPSATTGSSARTSRPRT